MAKISPAQEARKHNEALKKTIEYYRTIAKEQGRLTLEQAKELKSAREQLKVRKELTTEQQESLEAQFKHSVIRKRALENINHSLKSYRALGGLQEKQLEFQRQAVKGELELSDLESHALEIEQAQKQIKSEMFGTSDKQRAVLEEQLTLLESQYDELVAFNAMKEMQLKYEEKIKERFEESFPLLSKIKDTTGEFSGYLKTAEGRSFLIKAGFVAIVASIGAGIAKMTDFANETGFAYSQMRQFPLAVLFARDEMSALLNEFGSLDSITSSTLLNMKLLTFQYGISADSAATLMAQMMAISGATKETAMDMIGAVGELARANGVAPAAVLEDMASNTEFFASFAKTGGKNIAQAAVEARKLGLSLDTVSKIAESLLDFESSIEAQMEASVLVGRTINTEEARRLALAGDLAGMQREILKQVGSQADFERMSVIRRKALADAFGVGVDELSKMIMNQSKLNEMTGEQQKGMSIIQKILEIVKTAWAKISKNVSEFIGGLKIGDGILNNAEMHATKIAETITGWVKGIIN